MLDSRLAATESMTHDVIRDLHGVKLDMTNYVAISLLSTQVLLLLVLTIFCFSNIFVIFFCALILACARQ